MMGRNGQGEKISVSNASLNVLPEQSPNRPNVHYSRMIDRLLQHLPSTFYCLSHHSNIEIRAIQREIGMLS